ncbi:MAG: hypothetical protein ACLT9P_02100 [Evtepia gabavorous]
MIEPFPVCQQQHTLAQMGITLDDQEGRGGRVTHSLRLARRTVNVGLVVTLT